MPKKDPLALAVSALRARELHLASLERARRAAERGEEASDRRKAEALRVELREVARRADPMLRAWLKSDRGGVALRASPRARAIELAPLHIPSTLGGRPRFWHEPGEHRVQRAHKHYVVSLGQVFRFRLAAGSLGGCGGGDVPIRPPSFGVLAELDLRSRVGWPGQEHDVLSVALRVARIVADGELEKVVATSFARRANGALD